MQYGSLQDDPADGELFRMHAGVEKTGGAITKSMNNRNVILAAILATACITYAWIDTVGVSVTPT